MKTVVFEGVEFFFSRKIYSDIKYTRYFFFAILHPLSGPRWGEMDIWACDQGEVEERDKTKNKKSAIYTHYMHG